MSYIPSNPVIVCASDNRYALPLAVMLKSLAEGLRRDTPIIVWILDGGIGWRNRRRILRSVPGGVMDVRWIRPDETRLKEMPVFGHVSICTYYRLLLGDLLPADVEKVIYLDVDAIVLGDIGQLWDTDMAGKMVMAVPEPNCPVGSMLDGKIIAGYELSPMAPYFNAGVLLLDLKRWREDQMLAKALEFVRRFGGAIKFHDQDVLNCLLAHDWSPLEARWNWRVDHLWNGAESELAVEGDDAKIIHFASAFKPWDYRINHPARDFFMDWVDRTAWKGWRPRPPLRSTLGNRHWWGKWIRRIPVIGQVWHGVMNTVKRVMEKRLNSR